MEAKKRHQSFGVYEIALSGIMGAVTLVLAFSPVAFIKVPNVTEAATILHMPAIIAGIVAGPAVGAVVGLVLAATSWSMFGGVFLSFSDGNLAVALVAAFLPRLLIGPISWLTFRLVGKLDFKLSTLVACVLTAVIGTSVNTFGVLGTVILFGNMKLNVLYATLVANYPIEIAFAVIASIPVVEALKARFPDRIAALK